jgi:hypothetical protein
MKYRKLQGYKYELLSRVQYPVSLPDIDNKGFLSFGYIIIKAGILTVSSGYAWDGASGPTWDDKTNMRGSLIHDALYQLIREGLLEPHHRKYADQLLRMICIADGGSKLRYGLWYNCVRWFAKKSSKKRKNPRGTIVEL